MADEADKYRLFVEGYKSQLGFFQRPSLLAKTDQDESEIQSMRQCLSQNKALINQGFNIPPRQRTSIWLSFFPGGEELEPCIGGVGYLNRTYQVPPAEYTCFIF